MTTDHLCTHHHAHQPICGLPEEASVHVRDDERMRPGCHVWRHDSKQYRRSPERSADEYRRRFLAALEATR